MGNWTQLSLAGATEPIAAVGSGIAKVTGAISTAISIQKTALQIISALALDLLNVEALLIKAALSVLEDVLDQYIVTDAKIHMLVVPIRKRFPHNLASPYQMPEEDNSWAIDDAIDPATKKRLEAAFTRVAQYDQGNEGFMRTIIEETLVDEDDPNRPVYDEDDAIFATTFVMGAQTVVGIADLLRSIQGVLGTALQGNVMMPTTVLKTPQNLSGKTVAVPNSSRIGVLLKWENPPALQTLAKFDGVRVRIDEIAIIRSENDEIAVAKDWTAIFGGNQPSTMSDTDDEKTDVLTSDDKKSTVILQTRYEGVRNSFVDDYAKLVKNKDYYYALAYRYSLASTPSKTGDITWTKQSYFQISNIIKLRVRKKIPQTLGGTKPDWITHPSPLELIPDLKFFMALLEANINSLKSQTTGAAAALESYIKFLDAEATRYADFATDITAKVAKLGTLLQIPAAGVYVTNISASKGGTNYFIQELTRRMTDEDDSSAPPFHRNGFVAGVVMLAGAPNPAEFASVKTLMELLFGGGSGKTAFEEALDSVDRLLDDVEAKVFGDDMQTGTVPATTTGYTTFDDTLTGVAADDDDANVPFDP